MTLETIPSRTAGERMPLYRFENLIDKTSDSYAALKLAHREVVRTLYNDTGSTQDAEDAAGVAVDGYLRRVRACPDGHHVDTLTGYLTTSARNAHKRVAAARSREKRAERIHLELLEYIGEEVDDGQDDSDDPSRAYRSLLRRGHDDRNDRLRRALRDILTVREITVLFMHRVDKMTYGEIAERLGYGNPRTVGDWARAAQRKLFEHRDELGC